MLRLRVLTAVVGIPVILGAIYQGEVWYALLLLVIVNLGMREYLMLTGIHGSIALPLTGHLGVSVIIILTFLDRSDLLYPLVILLFLALFLNTLVSHVKVNIWESSLLFWGIIYLGGLTGFLMMLRMLPDGALYTYFLIGGVWANDTFAFFVGVKWGKRKLAPAISPKKSIEGSLAGIIGNLVLVSLVYYSLQQYLPFQFWQGILLAAGISIFAQLGDLLESYLKRQFKAKDSGSLLPGHGGVMDRFDSLIMAAPFVYFFLAAWVG